MRRQNKKVTYEIHFRKHYDEIPGGDWKFTGYYDKSSFRQASKVAKELLKNESLYDIRIVLITEKVINYISKGEDK